MSSFCFLSLNFLFSLARINLAKEKAAKERIPVQTRIMKIHPESFIEALQRLELLHPIDISLKPCPSPLPHHAVRVKVVVTLKSLNRLASFGTDLAIQFALVITRIL